MTSKKLEEKNLFESHFDPFEFDDGFLLQIDIDSKKNLHNKKEFGGLRKINPKEVDKSSCKGNDKNKGVYKSAQYYDLPLLIEDLNESDFFDFCKTGTHSSKEKVDIYHKDEKGKYPSTSNAFKNCLSPKFDSKLWHENNIASSTPLKSNDVSDSSKKEKKSNQKNLGNSPKNLQFDYLEADLFDDWDADEINKCETQKDTVTFSQALRLIEEAELEKQTSTTKTLDESIDMLTGEVVTADVHNFFEQSFDAMKPVKQFSDKEEFLDNSIIIIDEVNVKHKPPAAQKLNFDSESVDGLDSDVAKKKETNFGQVYFSSDDDLNFYTQDLLGKLKKKSKCRKPDQGVFNLTNKNTDSITVLKNFDLNDSNVDVFNVKRRKKVNVIESDTTEDSPSPKFRRQRKSKIRIQRIAQDVSVREFYDLEAEVTEEGEVSSDEVEEEGEYERSFLDEESYYTQNCSADMTAKYLQSVKNFGPSGTFKIPPRKPYNPKEVLSQEVEENNTDYQIDSFCVNEVEDETKTELSDLEIAEKILEMDEKKRKKRIQKSRKIK